MKVYAIQLGAVLAQGQYQQLMSICSGKVLFLTLTRNWFDLIRCGKKKEEFRECKPYWDKRMLKAPWDMIFFSNGYGSAVRSILVEYRGLIIKDIEIKL